MFMATYCPDGLDPNGRARSTDLTIVDVNDDDALESIDDDVLAAAEAAYPGGATLPEVPEGLWPESRVRRDDRGRIEGAAFIVALAP